MNPPPHIVAFRDLLRSKFPDAHLPFRADGEPAAATVEGGITGVALLDALGLGPGVVSEVVAAHASAGAGLLLLALLEAREEVVRSRVALVDGADAFEPAQASAQIHQHVLWLRCREAAQAVRAADLLLRDGNVPRVLLDLQLCPLQGLRRIPAQSWHRLRLLAEKSGACLCAFTPEQMVPCARSRLVLDEPLGMAALDEPPAVLLKQISGRPTMRGVSLRAPVLQTPRRRGLSA